MNSEFKEKEEEKGSLWPLLGIGNPCSLSLFLLHYVIIASFTIKKK